MEVSRLSVNYLAIGYTRFGWVEVEAIKVVSKSS